MARGARGKNGLRVQPRAGGVVLGVYVRRVGRRGRVGGAGVVQLYSKSASAGKLSGPPVRIPPTTQMATVELLGPARVGRARS